MNKTFKQMMHMALALLLALSLAAPALATEAETPELPAPTETVETIAAPTEAPAETPAPAAEEATAEPTEAPAETPAPAAEEATAEPTEEPAGEATQAPAAEPTEEPTEEPTPIPDVTGIYKVATAGLPLNYRVSPEGEIAGDLEDGTLVFVIEVGEEWTSILFDDKIYYVMTVYLAPCDPDETEPENPAMTLEELQAAVEKITISIYARDNVVVYGEAVQITASIPEELESAHLQWQQRDASGAWQNLPGETDVQVSVVITAENASSAWRVYVTVG